MKDTPNRQLLINYLLGICTPKELRNVEIWLDEEPENVLLLQQIVNDLKEKESPHINRQQIKRKVMEEVEGSSFNQNNGLSFIERINGGKKERSARKSFLRSGQLWMKAAAMVLVIMTAAALTFYYSNQRLVQSVSENSLHQRTLLYGQTATFRFNEGSVIKLNGGSTLRYPEQFEKGKREVYLEGEAFFNIARDEARPFIVHAGNTTTRVLGTSFNIKAYENEEEIQVTVAEGKVAVSQNISDGQPANKSKKIILEKDQWATYQNSGQLFEKGKGDIWGMIAWKEDVLIFNNKPFDEVARMLERWYGVDITLKGEGLKKKILKGEHKDASLEQVLESIQFILGIEYVMDRDTVTIRASKSDLSIKSVQ